MTLIVDRLGHEFSALRFEFQKCLKKVSRGALLNRSVCTYLHVAVVLQGSVKPTLQLELLLLLDSGETCLLGLLLGFNLFLLLIMLHIVLGGKLLSLDPFGLCFDFLNSDAFSLFLFGNAILIRLDYFRSRSIL